MFDITKHQWGDNSLQADEDPLHTDKHEITVDVEMVEFFKIYKQDAIAIARHFGLVNEYREPRYEYEALSDLTHIRGPKTAKSIFIRYYQ